MPGKPKKGPREKDLTSRYLSGGLDEDRVEPQQRFSNRSKSAQREKTAGALTSDPAVTHCLEGHLLDLENTNFSEDGARRCRTCKAQQAREWHSARRAPVGAAR